jgi:hypothetical protein
MENVAIALIEKLPEGYLMAALPVIAVIGIWIFTHIRRDKQGKWYFYSQKYEDRKRNKKQDAILRGIEDNGRDVLQLQVCAVDLPKVAKRSAYCKYKQRGYNGWMDDYVVENGLFTEEEVAYISENKEDGARTWEK